MGLFANLRKNKSEYDGSDDWLFDLQEDVDPSELASLGLPVSPAPEYEAFDVAASVAAPLTPPSGLSGWHLPDIENDRRISEPATAFELNYEINEPGPVAFAEPETPSYEPIDFAQPPAAGLSEGALSWADAPPPPTTAVPVPSPPPAPPGYETEPFDETEPFNQTEPFNASGFLELVQPETVWDVAASTPPVLTQQGFGQQGFGQQGFGQQGWEATVPEDVFPEAVLPEAAVWAPTDDAGSSFRSSIAEAWEPYVARYGQPVESQPVESQPVESPPADTPPVPWPSVDGPTAPEAAVLLEILGLFPGATWEEVRAAHRELIDGHRAEPFTDEAQAYLADEIRREMNSAYAALRLLAVQV